MCLAVQRISIIMYQNFHDNSLVSSGVCCNSLVVTEIEGVIAVDFEIKLVSDKERECINDDVEDDDTTIDDDKEEKDVKEVLMDVVSLKLAVDVSDKWIDGNKVDDDKEEKDGEEVLMDVSIKLGIDVLDKWIDDVKDEDEEEDEDRDIV